MTDSTDPVFTGNADADALLCFLRVTWIQRFASTTKRWLAGEIECDFNYRFLAAETNLTPTGVMVAIGYLRDNGWIKARDVMGHHARIRMVVRAEADPCIRP